MSWYNTAAYPEIDIDSRSLVVAFANLLKKLNMEHHDPRQLYQLLTRDDPVVDWWSLAEHVGDMETGEVSDTGWPPTNDAIVHFRRIDPAAGGVVDHHCLVADQRARSIVDSLDGFVKSAAEYGEPLGWASFKKYEEPAAAPLRPPVLVVPPVLPPKPGTTYRWVKGDNIWEVARRLDFRPMELLEHNAIDDPRSIQPGDILHLPTPRPAAPDRRYRVEVLPGDRLMHVIEPGNARKFSFGNARSWSDVKETGPIVRQYTNVTIRAIAHVPLDAETIQVYLDQAALGDYETTGRLAYTIGFSPNHLAGGHVERPKAEPPKAAEAAIAKQAGPVMDIRPVTNPNAWKALRPLYEDRRVVHYLLREDRLVYELEGRAAPRWMYKLEDVVEVRCTFEKSGIEYALPVSHETDGLWWDLPRHLLVPESEVYNSTLSIPERAALHKLTALEQYYWIPLARARAQYARFRTYIGKNKQKGSK